ncbi:peptidase inhibitor family I36 protein [Micromonospora sp. CPCC 206060]|uniref:peptidase inhibitor family I36 protein n=1 Tax=Micromonospora sp. CPCC 206060 TaxID=3122406 RepID=UPI003FA57D9D
MVAGVVVGAAATVVSATPAQAAWSACPANYSCYFPQVSGGGTPWLAPSCGWHNLPFTVVSVWNRGNGTISWYIGSSFTGWTTPVGYQGSNGALAADRVYVAC